ncbi:ubiquitinyl hydrolase 1 [Tilletia horrida]|nr:ubiquitinyl hydrolase 1 [Tilletia horrida]
MTTEKRLRWVPLEANPDIFNSWAASMGLDTDKLAYHDIYGTDDDLLQFIPQPVQAVLLLFPNYHKTIDSFRSELDSQSAEQTQPQAHVDAASPSSTEPPLIWFKQTIGNACGTIGLLHSVTSSGPYARDCLKPDSPYQKLIAEVTSLPPIERAKYLETFEPLHSTHATAAQGGQTSAPQADDDAPLHFVCFVRHNKSLFELDGNFRGPLDHKVAVETQEDLLKVAVQWIQKNLMQRYPESHEFNMIALAPVQS